MKRDISQNSPPAPMDLRQNMPSGEMLSVRQVLADYDIETEYGICNEAYKVSYE